MNEYWESESKKTITLAVFTATCCFVAPLILGLVNDLFSQKIIFIFSWYALINLGFYTVGIVFPLIKEEFIETRKISLFSLGIIICSIPVASVFSGIYIILRSVPISNDTTQYYDEKALKSSRLMLIQGGKR